MIYEHAAHESARYKWLDGGIDFVDEIPKSPSGKILRRLLRDMEKEKRGKRVVAKL
jgi:acyl-coenzyme A synthetase/AMP-(fatty) acid ligase